MRQTMSRAIINLRTKVSALWPRLSLYVNLRLKSAINKIIAQFFPIDISYCHGNLFKSVINSSSRQWNLHRVTTCMRKLEGISQAEMIERLWFWFNALSLKMRSQQMRWAWKMCVFVRHRNVARRKVNQILGQLCNTLQFKIEKELNSRRLIDRQYRHSYWLASNRIRYETELQLKLIECATYFFDAVLDS